MKRQHGTILILPVAFLLTFSGCGHPDAREEQAKWLELALSYGRLAPVPTNAQAFQIAYDDNYFGAFFFRFSASPQVIAQWIQDSEGLRGLKPTLLTPNHIRTPVEGDPLTQKCSRPEGKHTTPEWWRPSLTNGGMLYDIPGKQGAGSGGPFVVNNQSNTVFVYTRW